MTRYAFHHFPDVTDAIRQMNRMLAKGGKVLISDPMKKEQDKYISLYDRTTDEEKSLYDIENDNGVIWIKKISVGNTIFVKQ